MPTLIYYFENGNTIPDKIKVVNKQQSQKVFVVIFAFYYFLGLSIHLQTSLPPLKQC